MPRRSKGPYLHFSKRRGVWYIHINEHGGRRELSTGTADAGEAEAALGDFLAERRDASPSRRTPPGRTMIADVLADWYSERGEAMPQQASTKARVSNLLDYWGKMTVADITTARCLAYARTRGAAAGTIRRELGTLRAAGNYAVQERRLTEMHFIRLPKAPPGRERWLTRSEAAKLLRAALDTRADVRTYLPLFIILGLYTGARHEALLSLRWPQVNLEAGLIDFNPPGRTRTSKGRPIIKLSSRMVSHLKRARRLGSDLGHVINDGGESMTRVDSAFGSAAKRAGLVGVTPHVMRHTVGTWLAMKGVPLFEIGQWLGHSDARTTKLYAHHHPDHQEASVAAMG